MWAMKPLAIARENFAEDEGAVERLLASIVDSLAPRDALEAVQASNIAMLYLRLFRLQRFEAEALSGVGRPRKGPLVSHAVELFEDSYAIEVADWLIGVPGQTGSTSNSSSRC
jgi:hypothetical protein